MERTNMSDNNQPVGNNTSPAAVKMEFTGKGKAMILGSIGVVVVAVVVVAILLWPKPVDLTDELPSGGGVGVITEANVSTIQSEVREKVERGMFATYMNVTWRFPDGSSPSTNAVMGNSSSNIYPFWFTVAIVETSEIVYTSGLLPVGTQLDELILDEPLPAGRYPAVIKIHMVDENNEPMESNMNFNITLIVNT